MSLSSKIDSYTSQVTLKHKHLKVQIEDLYVVWYDHIMDSDYPEQDFRLYQKKLEKLIRESEENLCRVDVVKNQDMSRERGTI